MRFIDIVFGCIAGYAIVAVLIAIVTLVANFRISLIKWRFRAQEKIATAHGENILFSVNPGWKIDGEQKNFYSKEKGKHVEFQWAFCSFLYFLLVSAIVLAIPSIFSMAGKHLIITILLLILIFFLLWVPVMFFVRAYILNKQGTILLTEKNIIVFPLLFSNRYKIYGRNDIIYAPYEYRFQGRGYTTIIMFYIFYLSYDKTHKIFEIVDSVGNAEDFMVHFQKSCDSSIKVPFSDAPHLIMPGIIVFILIGLFGYIFLVHPRIALLK